MIRRIKEMIPIMLVICFTVTVSLVLYQSTTKREEAQCWQLLEDSAESVSRDIRREFERSVSLLHMSAQGMLQENLWYPDEIQSVHFEMLQENTLFDRIDAIYPDNTLLLMDGTLKDLRSDTSYEKILAEGEHMSLRMDDYETGKQAVYYHLPLSMDENRCVILTGVVILEKLSDYFRPLIYNGEARLCLIDSADGSYIMDSWHDGKLANAYNTPDRAKLKGYENVDLKSEIRGLKTGVIAFESRTTGRPLYMYYMPAGIFDWQLSVFADENVVFADVIHFKGLLIRAGIVEAILLILYFLWNLLTIHRLERSRTEAQTQLHISTTLIDCISELSSDKDMNISIHNLLRIINRYFDADRTYIFGMDKGHDNFVLTHEYVKHGAAKIDEKMHQIEKKMLMECFEDFNDSKAYYLSDIEKNMPAEIRSHLDANGTERIIAVPLSHKGKIVGFVGVDNAGQFYDDTTLLSSIRYFISNSLAAQKRRAKLSFLSYQDMLTSMYNRNRYIHQLEIYSGKNLKNIGVAYIDLNGLKKINDEQGHDAGDNFIRSSANVISALFPTQSYRIGGDEFVVIAEDTEQEIFSDRISRMRQDMDAAGISVSMGYIWQESCEDIECLLRQADGLMYKEKQRHYDELSASSKNA